MRLANALVKLGVVIPGVLIYNRVCEETFTDLILIA
jgi:hypothetical protein